MTDNNTISEQQPFRTINSHPYLDTESLLTGGSLLPKEPKDFQDPSLKKII